MNVWEMLSEAEKDPNVPFKLEVGEYSVARKPAAKGKSGEPAPKPWSYPGAQGMQPPAQRQRYIPDAQGTTWDMLEKQAVPQGNVVLPTMNIPGNVPADSFSLDDVDSFIKQKRKVEDIKQQIKEYNKGSQRFNEHIE